MDNSENLQEAIQYVRTAISRSAGVNHSASSGSAEKIPPDSRAVQSRYNILIPLKKNRVLAYNTRHASFALWGPNDLTTYESVDRKQLQVKERKLLDFLNGGFVVSERIDERGALEKQYKAIRFNEGIMNLTVAPTLGCNFGCDYCFQGSGKPAKLMKEEVQDAIVDHVTKQVAGLKRLHIAWYGGEPTLAPQTIIDLSKRIIPLCKKAKTGFSAFMVTNGFLLTRKLAEELLPYHIKTYQVTLDGPEKYHNGRRALLNGGPTYERIVTNLCDIVSGNVPVTIIIRINIDERNRDTIKDLIDDLAARGLAGNRRFRIYFAPVRASTMGCHSCSEVTMQNIEYGRTEAELHDYAFDKGLASLPQPPRLLGNCQAVRPMGMIVLPNGDIHKCWDTVAEEELKVGSIFEVDSFPKDIRHKKWLSWLPLDIKACRECTLLPSCMGFCAYKHLYNERTMGEAASIPCPSWKYNMNERLFLRAKKRGFVTADDWDEERSPTAVTARDTFWKD